MNESKLNLTILSSEAEIVGHDLLMHNRSRKGNATSIRRGGSWATATSKMERFVIIVNGWKPLTIITKRSILDVAAALDPPLIRH